jgi:hypothetical protein
MKYTFFIAGIIQGSECNLDIYNQKYRDRIKSILQDNFQGVTIYCPFHNHPNSVTYNDNKAKSVFLEQLQMVKQSHSLIVYLPEASMGSSIEMWEAYHQKTLTITITPMRENWVVRILSDYICKDFEQFQNFIVSGKMIRMLEERYC